MHSLRPGISSSRSESSITAMSLQSKRRAQEAEEKRDHFLDPITFEVMRDPVFCDDGYTYDRSTLLSFVKNSEGHRLSPYSRAPIRFWHDNVQLRGDIFDAHPEIEKAFGDERRHRESVNPPMTAALNRPTLATLPTALVGGPAAASVPLQPARAEIVALSAGYARFSAGVYTIGSAAYLVEQFGDFPQQQVQITRPFEIQRTPTTLAQWVEVFNTRPRHFSSYSHGESALERPVCVSWYNAIGWCAAKDVRSGVEPFYDVRRMIGSPGDANYGPPAGRDIPLNLQSRGLRLPWEVEWEIAALIPNLVPLGQKAWYSENSGGRLHPVAQKNPSEKDMYDMLGNVWEWAGDAYSRQLDWTRPIAVDPRGPLTGADRVCRGGSWSTRASGVRPSDRNNADPSWRDVSIGFRPARSVFD